MLKPICKTCGTQYETSAVPPPTCFICEDERQYVGWEGQQWTTMEALAGLHRVRLTEDEGILGMGLDPPFAIDQRAAFLPTGQCNVMWECLSLVTDEAVAMLEARGGIDVIAISHPHFYSSMVEWSEAFGGVPILVHEADRAWVARPNDRIRFWSGDRHAIAPGVSLIRCGGHFPGSAALHWRNAARPAGALFPGDAAQVAVDRRHTSFLYSYPNMIPMPRADVEGMRERLADLTFADVYGYTWGRNIIGDGRCALDRSFERYLLT